MSEAHYLNKLYPMQDKVFQIFSEAEIKHYLTGGTALSRAFLHHRYSDDLDFFLNNDQEFEKESDRAVSVLNTHFKKVIIENSQSGFRRIFITESGVLLKLDLINDVTYHFNGFEKTDIYYKTDNPLNILSNKITALSRQASKDIADIICLCRNYSFTWPDILEQSKQKDSWVNEVDVLAAIKTFETEKLFSDIIWIKPNDPLIIKSDLKKICFDIASAGSNSLHLPAR